MRSKLTPAVHILWWVRPYIGSIILFAWVMGTTPDNDKMAKIVAKGIKFKLAPRQQPDGPTD